MGKTRETEIEKEKDTNVGAIFMVAMISVLLILVGAAMTFVPDMKAVFFAYIAGAAFLVAGLFLILRYFIKQEYRVVSNYDFSAGVLLAVLGIVALVRADEIAGVIAVYAGMLMLVNAVIFLQYTVQLKILKAGFWWVVTAIVTVLITLASLETLLGFLKLFEKNPTAFYIVLMVVGVIGLLWIVVVALGARKFLKTENEMMKRNLEEDVTVKAAKHEDHAGPINMDDPDFIDRL